MEIRLKILRHAIPASMFIVEHTIKSASVCDVSQRHDHQADGPCSYNCFRTARVNISCLANLFLIFLAHELPLRSIKPMWEINLSSPLLLIPSQLLRSNTAFRVTRLKSLILYSADSHKISTDMSSQTMKR